MKSYERHKPSGVGWIGEIPEHWNLKKLKFFLDLRSGDGITSEAINSEGEYKVYGGNGFRGFYSQFTHDGDFVLIGRQGALCGNVNVASGKFWASDHAVVVSPTEEVGFVWLRELLTTMNLNQYSQSAAQPGLSVEVLKNLIAPVPPYSEQITIADYLDKETARIDEVVGKKKRLIELLKEERLAIINQAVTRGLDPNAKLKPSNIEWLGDIPASWKILPIKYLVATKVTDGPHETPEFYPEGVPFASAEAVKNGKLNLESVRGCISKEQDEEFSRKVKPRRNDIFIVKSGATTGRIAIVDFDDDFNIWSPLALVRTNEKMIHAWFIYYSLQAIYFQDQIKFSWSFGTQQNIGMGVIENLRVMFPFSVAEQKQIVEHIITKTRKIDATIAKVEKEISLLNEYRTALISEVVTGKIKVS